MAVKIVDGDLFTTNARYICHQVNCQGKMGSGVAKMIRSKFPGVYEQYRKMCARGGCLGSVLYAESNDKIIVNMFAQDRYGRDGARYTDYDAFMQCLEKIHSTIPYGRTIAMPYGIGCGLGGGDWEIISRMIEQELGQDYTVELWRL